MKVLSVPKIGKLFCEFPTQISTCQSKSIKKDMFFTLDIMQVTFVTLPFVDSPTSSLSSQGMGAQAKMSNVKHCCFTVTKHMSTQFQLWVSRQQMGRDPRSAWLDRRGHPCMMSTTSSQFVSMCPRVRAIQFPPYRMQPLKQIDHNVSNWKGDSSLYAIGIPISKARGRSEAEGAPAPPQAARGYPHFVPPSFEAMQGLLAC